MSEKSSVRKEIALVAGPREWGENNKSLFSRVAKKVPTVSFRTVRALWYGEIQDDNHWAARDIRRAAEEIMEARREAAALADRYQSIAGGMRVTDEDFHSPQIDRLEYVIRRLGVVASPRTRTDESQ